MADRHFVVKKEANSEVITYMEYEKLKGYNVKPKKSTDIYDMINVNEMVIINPTLIEKLVDKKCKRTLEAIIKMLSVIYDDGEDSDGALHKALTEIDKFNAQIENKYKEYMKEKEYKLLLKKLEILRREVLLRVQMNEINYYREETKKAR